jgi:hypothetical protein
MGFVTDMKLQFSGLYSNLTPVLLILFCGDISKPRSMPMKSILEKN